MRIICDLGGFTARSLRAGAAYFAVGLGISGLVFTSVSCNTKKERKGEVIPPGKPGASTAPNNVTGGGNQETGGTPGGSGAGSYFTPRKRPANITVDGKSRPVNNNDIFITPVYVKSEAWFRTCVKAISGASPLGIGCSLADASPKPPAEMPALVVDNAVGIPLDKGGQKITLTFESFKSAVVKCTDSSARKTSTTGNCPGAVDSVSFDIRSTATANSVIKCAKSGDVLVVFYEDQETALVEKNNTFRGALKSTTGSAPLLPNFKDIFSDPPLTTSYSDAAKGTQITEQDVRKKFGVDFQDLILQVDLGSAGNSVAGLESCQ
jgi:hypothetical protein